MENFYTWLAWKIPHRLAAWAVIRVFSYASMRLPNKEVPSITWDEALRAWEE